MFAFFSRTKQLIRKLDKKTETIEVKTEVLKVSMTQ